MLQPIPATPVPPRTPVIPAVLAVHAIPVQRVVVRVQPNVWCQGLPVRTPATLAILVRLPTPAIPVQRQRVILATPALQRTLATPVQRLIPATLAILARLLTPAIPVAPVVRVTLAVQAVQLN